MGWFDSHCHVQEEYLGWATPGCRERPERDGSWRRPRAGLGPGPCGRHRPPRLRRDRGGDLTPGRGVGPGDRQRRVAAAGVGVHRAAPARGERGRGRGGGAARTASWRRTTVPWWPSASAGSTTTTSTRPRAAQRAAFAAQIALAHAHGLALVIHARDAWADLFDVLDGRRRSRAHRAALLHRRARRGRPVPAAPACTSPSAAS